MLFTYMPMQSTPLFWHIYKMKATAILIGLDLAYSVADHDYLAICVKLHLRKCRVATYQCKSHPSIIPPKALNIEPSVPQPGEDDNTFTFVSIDSRRIEEPN
jgi:hypothetical protein